jgi:hypothetical protein
MRFLLIFLMRIDIFFSPRKRKRPSPLLTKRPGDTTRRNRLLDALTLILRARENHPQATPLNKTAKGRP